ncbi:hypothetical protein B9479_002677 [Cryptococcus floricola]|uniref:PEX18/PEX21 C-terminal domain-containing protein n=1 Tax=Cryptococcus floricola TaxID=2591691 RepID=A0A5D3AZ04_9TREE|nr:hypothetical protein B9479_002677 [Cryptococcus floricola]
MSAFLDGAAQDCGPTSVLKNVSQRVDVDRSLHQDRFAAGPSSAPSKPFGGYTPSTAGAEQRGGPSRPSPFDLSSLRQHLSPPVPNSQTFQSQPSNWAMDFVPKQQTGPSPQRVHSPPASSPWQTEFSSSPSLYQRQGHTLPSINAGPAPWEIRPQQYRPIAATHGHVLPRHFSPGEAPHEQFSPANQYQPPIEGHAAQSSVSQEQTAYQDPLSKEQGLLAETARNFVDSSSSTMSQNPKLAQSNFMALVRSIADESTVVKEDENSSQTLREDMVGEGAKFVQRGENNWASNFVQDKGKAREGSMEDDAQRRSPYPEGDKSYPALGSWLPALPGHAQAPVMSIPPPPNCQMPAAPPAFANVGAQASHSSNEQDGAWEQQFRDQEALLQSTETRRKSVHFDSEASPAPESSGVPNTLEEALASRVGNIPGSGWGWHESGLTTPEGFDEETFNHFAGALRWQKEAAPGQSISEQEGWDSLADEWDGLVEKENLREKVVQGMGVGDREERYLFMRKNPYAEGVLEEHDYGMDAEQARDSPTIKNILELEAAVQSNPTSANAWFALGLKQQENEHEAQAILALSKTIQLDPSLRDAYLALAVSYTNESESEAGCTMLERWVAMGEEAMGLAAKPASGGRGVLIERLIDMARSSPEEVDPDVQVALGVMFNMVGGEDYLKAEDCFLAALAARPNDWLLYNRLGATLANSGRSNEAISYYHKALLIHPSFVRALFNLGIAYLNLGQYKPAAQSIVDALRLQHADASEGYSFAQREGGMGGGSKGVGSDALWSNLRGACIHMNRHDLIEIIERKDLASLPMDFVDQN